MSSHFKRNLTWGFDFDLSYNNLITSLNCYLGYALTKHDFTNNEQVWKTNSTAESALGELNIGYKAINNNYFRIIPSIGLGLTEIEPKVSDSYFNECYIKPRITYTSGLNFDIKLNNPFATSINYSSEYDTWIIRLRYNYALPQFAHPFAGAIHYFSIGIGGFSSKTESVYDGRHYPIY